jgi:nicotinate-nucleotide adenylyltransferase
VDTLAELRKQSAAHELVLIMGGDTLNDFPTWQRPADICRLARIAVVTRSDFPAPNLTVLQPFLPADGSGSPLHVIMPAIGISSSQIRERVAAGKTIRYLLPRSVEKFIQTHRLYQK